ncbi:MAG: Tetratricopeptide repeat [Actinomycetota bacterium]|jgi:thioredoxin-like negative regulator of GroEL|nr:Tetratricopeptide repeat [Actinomycetota bacterium]
MTAPIGVYINGVAVIYLVAIAGGLTMFCIGIVRGIRAWNRSRISRRRWKTVTELHGAGHVDEANAIIARWRAEGRSNVEDRLGLAWAMAAVGDHSSALAAIEGVPSDWREGRVGHFRMLELSRIGDLSGVKRAAEERLRTAPFDIQAQRFYVWSILEGTDFSTETFHRVKGFLAQTPEDLELSHVLRVMHVEASALAWVAGDQEGADEHAAEAQSLGPDAPNSLGISRARVRLLEQAGRFEELIALCEDVRGGLSGPHDRELGTSYAMAYWRLGRLDQAEESLQRAEIAGATDDAIPLVRALIETTRGNAARAEELMLSATEAAETSIVLQRFASAYVKCRLGLPGAEDALLGLTDVLPLDEDTEMIFSMLSPDGRTWGEVITVVGTSD